MNLEREQEEAMYNKLEKRRVKETHTVGELSSSVEVEFGTTLRDEIVMAALTGLIVRAGKWELDVDLDTTINKAFYIADRVMKAREKNVSNK